MPFCYSPWTNIDIDPQGAIAPCCKFQYKVYKEKFNIQTHTIKQYSKSDFLQEIREDFIKGNWPSGCERCKIEEQNSIESKRNLDYTRWKNYYEKYNLDSDEFITASIAFGNTCNLKCITCGPYASSKWQQEYKIVYGIDVAHNKFYKNNFVKDFVESAPSLIHFDIPGGEPLLSGVQEQKQLLGHYIQSGKAQYISLHYTTNATIFPDQEWWEIWSHFRNVDIQLSIDGIGDRYEYIRHPGNWKTLVDHTQKYLQHQKDNIQLSVSHTVSAYNIYYLDEFFEWCYAIGLPCPWLGRVHSPDHMRPSVWTGDARAAILDKLSESQYPDVHAWKEMITNSDDSASFETFKNFLHQHDQYRGTDFAKTFPELARYVQNL
jgi:MoaA/NifB/PqqE/SkfB family radical SAM enzyme